MPPSEFRPFSCHSESQNGTHGRNGGRGDEVKQARPQGGEDFDWTRKIGALVNIARARENPLAESTSGRSRVRVDRGGHVVTFVVTLPVSYQIIDVSH